MDEISTPFLRYAEIKPPDPVLCRQETVSDQTLKKCLDRLQGITIPVRDEVMKQLMERLRSERM